MARKSRHSRFKRSPLARPSTWLSILAALAIPLAAGYLFFTLQSLSTDLPETPITTSAPRFNDPVVTVTPAERGPIEQLVVSSSVILNPESAELYQRIARETGSKPAPADKPAEQPGARAEILGPGWLLSQAQEKFTIQFLTSADMDELLAFNDQFNGAEPATIYPYKRTGQRVEYGLARGVYDTLKQAQQELQGYPPELTRHEPWIRPIARVSRQIESFLDR